jgi:hypothetical protein
LAISDLSYGTDESGDLLLELLDVETGDVLESTFLSRLINLENDGEDYSLAGQETETGELVLVAESSDESHALRIGLEGFDSEEDLSTSDGSFGLFGTEYFGQPILTSVDGDFETLSFLDTDFTELRVVEVLDGLEIAGLYERGVVLADLSSDNDVVFTFTPVVAEESQEVSITLSRTSDDSYPSWIGEIGSNYLFAEEDDDEWELLLVSPESEILESLSVDAPLYSYGNDFVKISNDKVYVVQEFREEFSVAVYNSSLTELLETPLDRVESASWGYTFPEAVQLGKLLLLADDSFAFLDTQTDEVTRFRSLSDSVYYLAGLGFSSQAFFIVDRGELVSYDLDLGSAWSFKLLDDESILRAGENLFLNREGDKEVSLLLSQ